MKKTLLLAAFLMASINAQSKEIFTMSIEEFYKVKQYQDAFEQIKANGKLEQMRGMATSTCTKEAKDDAEKKRCICLTEYMGKIDDKVIFYDSLVAYQLFTAKVNAKQSQNEAEYKRLDKIGKERLNVAKQAEQACAK